MRAATVARKLLLAGLVAAAGPLNRLWWAEEYTGLGMNQRDLMLIVAFVSSVLAGSLLVAFVVSGYVLRCRQRWQVAVDLALFGVVFGLAVYAGMTARVVDAKPVATATTDHLFASRGV